MNELIGKWAFVIGLILAVIAGLVSGYNTTILSSYTTAILLVLFVLGLIIGFLNIHEKNETRFLVSVVALLVLGVASISALSVLQVISEILDAVLGNFIAFVSAAALVVSIKAILETTKK